jgi:DNA-binding NtrC family response regulator
VTRGVFRLDLYHRLDVFHVMLPPLRERREDIVLLARHFLGIMSTRMGRATLRFTPSAEAILQGYDYPGNARELRNIVERAVILSGGDTVDSDSIMLTAQRRPHDGAGGAFFSVDPQAGGAPPSLAELEKAYIARLLEFTGGNRTQVARILGISYPTIAKKILDYGL